MSKNVTLIRALAPLLVAAVVMGAMVSRGGLAPIRTVDALTLFVSGACVGVGMVRLLSLTRT